MKKMYIIGIILAIVIIAIIGFFAFSNNNAPKGDLKIIDASALTEKGTLKLNGETKDENSGIFSSTASDENAVLVNKTSILKLTKSFINKTGNTATSGDDADFYGVNSAVLVKDASKLTIEIHQGEMVEAHLKNHLKNSKRLTSQTMIQLPISKMLR